MAAVAEAVATHWTDDQLGEAIPMYGEQWKRSFVLAVLIAHQTHHRGQLTLLMRKAGRSGRGTEWPRRTEILNSSRWRQDVLRIREFRPHRAAGRLQLLETALFLAMGINPLFKLLGRTASGDRVVQIDPHSHGAPVGVGRAFVALPDWISGEVGHATILPCFPIRHLSRDNVERRRSNSHGEKHGSQKRNEETEEEE
jgi:hypothetical protein